MKKTIILSFLLFLLLSLLFFLPAGNKKNNTINYLSYTPTPTVTPTAGVSSDQEIELELNQKKYQAAWFVVSDINKIKLYSNHSGKLSTQILKDRYYCRDLINANFYDTRGNSLGLFLSEGKTFQKEIGSSLFNGVFSLDKENSALISDTLPDKEIRLAVQSGPILWDNNKPKSLKIIDDKIARRIIIAILENNKIAFLTFFDKNSPLQGPYLEEVPVLISQLNDKENLKILSALNLDGGSASAFYHDSLILTEVNPVGGFFCVQ